MMYGSDGIGGLASSANQLVCFLIFQKNDKDNPVLFL